MSGGGFCIDPFRFTRYSFEPRANSRDPLRRLRDSGLGPLLVRPGWGECRSEVIVSNALIVFNSGRCMFEVERIHLVSRLPGDLSVFSIALTPDWSLEA